jgi:hypothetical protein
MAKMTNGTKAVAAAGTRERLVALAQNISVKAVTLVAKQGNTGPVYAGNDTVANNNTPPLNPGDAVSISADEPFNLSDLYLDVSVSGEGVDYCALA